jgi:hypothetical protein
MHLQYWLKNNKTLILQQISGTGKKGLVEQN